MGAVSGGPARSGARLGDQVFERLAATQRRLGVPQQAGGVVIGQPRAIHLVGELLASRGACEQGMAWTYARPPVQGLEFEMDVRRVARDILL